MTKSLKSTQTKSCDFYIREDDILMAYHHPDIYYTLEFAVLDVKTIENLMDGRYLPLLVDMRDLKAIAREAREHFAGEHVKHVTPAIALLIDSTLSRVIGNFFMSFNKLKVPVQLFSSEQKAVEWLYLFLNKKLQDVDRG